MLRLLKFDYLIPWIVFLTHIVFHFPELVNSMLAVFLYITEFLKIPIFMSFPSQYKKETQCQCSSLRSQTNMFIFKPTTLILKLSLIFTCKAVYLFCTIILNDICSRNLGYSIMLSWLCICCPFCLECSSYPIYPPRKPLFILSILAQKVWCPWKCILWCSQPA